MDLHTFLAAFIHTEGCAFPSLYPCIIHGTNSFKTIVGHLFEGRSPVTISSLVTDSNIFSEQCYELLRCVLRDFADLRRGWITHGFPTARENVEKRHKK